MWLTRISVKYPVFTIMMMFCLMVLGLASWQRMGVEEFPDVDDGLLPLDDIDFGED